MRSKRAAEGPPVVAPPPSNPPGPAVEPGRHGAKAPRLGLLFNAALSRTSSPVGLGTSRGLENTPQGP